MEELKKYKTIKAVCETRKTKKRASVELSLSLRQVNRLLAAYKEKGKAAFIHGNRGRTSSHAMPTDIKKKVIDLYRDFGDWKPNVVHFCEILLEDYKIDYTDTTIRNLLYKEGLLSPKSHRKTRRKIKQRLKEQAKKEKYEELSLLPRAEDKEELPEKAHPSRPRKKYRGELIQMDASEYYWFNDQKYHLHLAIDDASGDIVGGYFDTQETLHGYYHVLYQILTKHGIPALFLTDKRTVFEYKSKNSKKLSEDTFTQFGFACHQLGIEIKTTSVPESKGRVERLNNTLQSRFPIDARAAKVNSVDEANNFLAQWILEYNKKFGNKTSESVFETSPTLSKINLILARVHQRVFDAGHHIRYFNQFYLTIKGNSEKLFTRGTKALVIEAFDGDIYLNVDEQTFETRKLLEHELHSEEFDLPQETKKERHKYIPKQSHPWKLASFNKYLRSVGKTLQEYETETPA